MVLQACMLGDHGGNPDLCALGADAVVVDALRDRVLQLLRLLREGCVELSVELSL